MASSSTAAPPTVAEPAVDESGRPAIGLGPDAPAWAHDALADTPRESRFGAGDARMELLGWGERADPGILLLHGHGAHADWWRVIAPQLVGTAGQVAAYSMAGMGGSEWRREYDIDQFGQDAVDAAQAAGLIGAGGPRPWLVAHSFGCLAALLASERLGDAIAGLVLIDFYLPQPGRGFAKPQHRKHRRYAGFTEAMARFRLSPEQDSPNPWLVDFVGRRTLRWKGDHWTWCTDPDATTRVPHDRFRQLLPRVKVPLTILRGERSRLVDRAMGDFVLGLAPAGTRLIDIPDADHHVLLDQPLPLVAALRAIIGGPTA